MSIIKDGVDFADFNERSWEFPHGMRHADIRLPFIGVGMADEWPIVFLQPDFEHNHGGSFEKDMVLCVETLIAEEGSESIKLETQVLVTEAGVERIDRFPWEEG